MGKSDAIYEDFLTYDNGQSSSQCPVNSAPCTVRLSLFILFPSTVFANSHTPTSFTAYF